ncbi:hypothetical protein ID866_5828 [Astraeus odoratus]|nr:hypothetical protein ID866_5828 [Astraeus odoratus]
MGLLDDAIHEISLPVVDGRISDGGSELGTYRMPSLPSSSHTTYIRGFESFNLLLVFENGPESLPPHRISRWYTSPGDL